MGLDSSHRTILLSICAAGAVCLVATAGCAGSSTPAATGPAPVSTAPPATTTTAAPVSTGPQVVKTTLKAVGLEPSAMDRSADPCQDFFQYACGGWLAKTKIPADKSRYGRFNEIYDRNQKELKHILETAEATKSESPMMSKLGAFYGSCMNRKAINKAGTSGIAGLLKTARRVHNRNSLDTAIAILHRHRIWPLFSFGRDQDYKNSMSQIGELNQGGLGLPDRNYYLKKDKKIVAIRTKYQAHVARMFELLGQSHHRAARAAKDVMKIETALAKASLSRVALRDPNKTYHMMDRAALKKLAPHFPWGKYLKSLDVAKTTQKINVSEPNFIKAVDKLTVKVHPSAWRNYLTWKVLDAMAATLPKKFVDEDFNMEKLLTGAKKIRPRWKRCVSATDRALGDYLAQPYVKAMFPGASKQAAQHMIAEIKTSFTQVVKGLDWMTPKTKKYALYKLHAMADHIGYPDKWKTYDFKVNPNNYAKNVLVARAFNLHRSLQKIGKPTDRGEWYMTAPTVNAYDDILKNLIVFPAGILQPPFFNAKNPPYINLGSMGMIVGHELTHGFDDEGHKFDAHGNLKNWWQPADAKRFKKESQCLINQYSKYSPVKGVHLNGKLTDGENIADNGGVKLAFMAYRRLRKQADKIYVADGFNEDQQFFLAVGQSWCTKSRPEDVRRRVMTDPHSMARFRVDGSLSNLHAFAKAFQCKLGTPMHPKNTCQVW